VRSLYIYPKVITELLEVCHKHLQGLASIDELQFVVQRSESMIVALEEKDVRIFLTSIEGELELIRFTVEENLQDLEGKKIARKLIDWIQSRSTATE